LPLDIALWPLVSKLSRSKSCSDTGHDQFAPDREVSAGGSVPETRSPLLRSTGLHLMWLKYNTDIG